eukprot:SAG31_NODE_41799_length_274_cov_0.880000_1_plen_49_part_01
MHVCIQAFGTAGCARYQKKLAGSFGCIGPLALLAVAGLLGGLGSLVAYN